MMLAVENWETGSLEIAIILDESPSRQYLVGASTGEPWRPGGPLSEAARTADMEGYAWMSIIFKNDTIRSWGSKRVKLVSGGDIYTLVRTRAGADTPCLRRLRYEQILPKMYRALTGELNTNLDYKALSHVEMMLDPDMEPEVGECDELLGYAEHRYHARIRGAARGEDEHLRWVHPALGCRLVWTARKQYNEEWFLSDAQGFKEFRFALTEYARRPYIGDILTRLGFVAPETLEEAATIRKRALRQLRGHMQNLTNSLRTIANMLDSGSPSQRDVANGATAFPVKSTQDSSDSPDSLPYANLVTRP